MQGKPPRPVVNRAHPLARGLVFAAVVDSARSVRDVARSRFPSSTNGTPTDVVRQYGRAIVFTGSEDFRFSFPIASPALREFTISMRYRFRTGDNCRMYASNAANTHYSAGLGIATSQPVVNAAVGGVGAGVTGATTLTNGAHYHHVGLRRGTTGYVYLNGRLDGSGALVTTGGVTDPLGDMRFGGLRFSSVDYFATGEIFDAHLWNRALTAQEVAALYADPWAMYRATKAPLRGIPTASTARSAYYFSRG